MRDALVSPAAVDRFELRGQLGSGGMGVVYRVLDRARNKEVALKTLKSSGGRELYRFKREFRALADLAHPNLVQLYELYTVGEEWMFTMELVDGVPFNKWVRPLPPAEPDDFGPYSEESVTKETRFQGERPTAGPLDEKRLEEALYQLADGLAALHAAGKLHRDVKPSNVLVDRDGRVVILDFGLIADVDSFHADRTHERAAVGTPAYMSPEQAADKPLTDASDWYSVGCMLYEALTGRRPFEGSPDQVLNRKQHEVPTPPSQMVAGVPPTLERLCMQLLSRDPMRRPDGASVIGALGRTPSVATERITQMAARSPFVGRIEELATLRRALGDSRQRCVATLVLGKSGMGKSALLRAFLDEVSVDGEAVILEGRCYERETVPYKALDQVVDGLTAFLVRLPRTELDKLMPVDVSALVRLFPVMRRVPGMQTPILPGALPGDPVELRRRAFEALREILTEIAETRPVVIAIDDLQWGDIDGAWGLAQLIRPPSPPRVLVVASHRLEDVEASIALETLKRWNPDGFREMTVGALPDLDARDLWTVLGGDILDASAVRDAGGNPLLLSEIARARLAGEKGVHSVEDAVRLRMERLDGDSRAMLHTVSVASRPMRPEIIAAAAGIDDTTGPLATLRLERLVRIGAGTTVTVEPYHDRIRESVVAAMSDDELRNVHGRIARALSVDESGDRELMIEHWLGAGDGARAGKQAERAAHEAEERFAFHRAAELYALALLHGEMNDATRSELTARRAQTLTAAGRLVEAAVEFRVAASLTRGRAKFALERRSVEQLLRAGHLERGVAAAHELLDEVGVKMPTTWRRTLVPLVIERLRIRMRGLEFEEKPEKDVDPDLLERLDVLWSVSSGFSFVNPVLGRVMQARLLREALAAGELRRVVQAYGLELGYLSMPGDRMRDRAEAVLSRARGLALQTGAPEVRGYIEVSGALASYLAGRFREAHDRFHEGEMLMRQHPGEMRWQLDLTEIFRLATLWCLGELRELLRLHPEYLRSAEERGNVYSQRGLRGWRSNIVWLIRGEPAEARRQADRASPGRGKSEPFHLQHYYDVLSNSMIDLYTRDSEALWERVSGAWKEIVGSHLLRIQHVDAECHWLRGSAAVMCCKQDRSRIDIAEECVTHLRKIGSPYARVVGGQLCAAMLIRRGERDDAIEALRATIAASELAEMAAHGASARLRLGIVLGGNEGRALVEHAEQWMRDQGVADPTAFASMLSPGLAEGS